MIDPSPRDNSGSAATPIRVILPVLALAVITISVGSGILLPQLPALVERLLGVGSTPAQVSRATGLLTASYMLALFICAPVRGWLSDSWGRRRILLIGLIGFSATISASVLFDTLATIYVGRALTGKFAAAFTSVTLAAVTDMSSGKAMLGARTVVRLDGRHLWLPVRSDAGGGVAAPARRHRGCSRGINRATAGNRRVGAGGGSCCRSGAAWNNHSCAQTR